jgi:N-methylhydantoinase A
MADLRHDFVQTINRPLEEVTAADIESVLSQQHQAGERLLTQESVVVQSVEVHSEAELHYQGQIHMLNVPLQSSNADPAEIGRSFAAAFKARFAIELPTMTVVLANLRSAVFGRRVPIDLAAFAPKTAGTALLPAATRPVWFAGEAVPTWVYRRDELGVGVEIHGPAIVEQMDTTIVLDPATHGIVDRLGNLILSIDPERHS